MRHEPLAVDRVAVETPADLVVEAAVRHPLAGEAHDVQEVAAAGRPVVAEQELEDGRVRELRRPTEPPMVPVDQTEQAFGGSPRPRRVERALARPRLLDTFERGEDPVDGPRNLVRLVAIGARHRLQEARKARQAVAVDRGEVGPAIEGLAVGREKDGHRPTAAPGEHLDGSHVDVVDVRALLTIHFHVHEQIVHEPRGALVLERLPLHHVTPVAGGISDREQDGSVLGARARESFLAPRIPIDGVVGVLEEVWARLVGETVRRRRVFHGRMVAPAPPMRNARVGAPAFD